MSLSDQRKYVFFLGGADLEMSEIRLLLLGQGYEENLDFFDKKLTWETALLSAYQPHFPADGRIPVGIELREDVDLPAGYLSIDHHNERSSEPASILQVAKLLGVELTRYQNLVAANDSGYIPGMEKMGATPVEIKLVREKDRQMQGVTEEDENTAEQELKNIDLKSPLIKVKTSLNHFSPLLDRLYGAKRILIYNEQNLNFYGWESRFLVDTYQGLIEKKQAYFGGDPIGFFGVSNYPAVHASILDEITEIMDQNDLISRHIFLFPFKWNTRDTSKTTETSFSDSVRLDKFEEAIFGEEPKSVPEPDRTAFNWYREKFKLSSINGYNEFYYFYDYVREVLYDLESPPASAGADNSDLIRHYELGRPEGFKYVIQLEPDPSPAANTADKKTTAPQSVEELKCVKLDIDSIQLNVFGTGVAILSFFLGNRDETQADPDTILKINALGRRLYPPFFSLPPMKIGTSFEFQSSPAYAWEALGGTKKVELPQAIALEFSDGKQKNHKEDFISFSNLEDLNKQPFRLPNYISCLFPKAQIHSCSSPGAIDLAPVLDDRMAVLCWYGGKEKVEAYAEVKREKAIREAEEDFHKAVASNPEGKHEMQEVAPLQLMNPNNALGDFWYRFLFVDNATKTVFDDQMGVELIQAHTYRRWLPLTAYGVSRYSFVSLTSSLAVLRENNVAFLPQHVESIYYRMYELALVQRASVLRFADEITHFAHLKSADLSSSDTKYEHLTEQVTDLYQNYIRFINKIFFREVTAQEQGIELYDMIQGKLRLEKQVQDLDKELNELHTFVKLVEDRNMGKKLSTLTILGALLLIPTFVVSLLGLKPYEAAIEHIGPLGFIGLAGFVLLGLATLRASGVLFNWKILRRHNRLKKSVWWAVIAFLIFMALVLSPILLTYCA